MGRDKTSQSIAVTVDQLATQFGGVVTDTTRPQTLRIPCGPYEDSSFHSFRSVTVENVLKQLKLLDERKTSGSDGIPCVILKRCAATLAPSLTLLINMSLETGIVPKCLKLAHVRPLFKGGDAEVAKNYRPVSLLPVISKLLERVVHGQLAHHLQQHNLLPSCQFAYRSNHSTDDAVLLAVDRYLTARDTHNHTGIAFLDMSKAFDKVRHQQLIIDLHDLGIGGPPLEWFRDYLSHRQQMVVLKSGESSGLTDCTCGVPQGSVLGPLLFLIYTRDVANVVKGTVNCQMFADDIMVDYSSSSVRLINHQLSEGVSHLADYLRDRGLILNEDETQIVGIHRTKCQDLTLDIRCNGKQLKQCKSAKYLGVIFDDNLQWNSQVNNIVRKVCHKLHTLWIIRKFITTQLALQLYQSLIVPDLCYASNAYFSSLSAASKNKLVKLCKRSIRCVAGVDPLTPTALLFSKFKVQPVLSLLANKLKQVMFRVHNNRISGLISSRIERVQLSRVYNVTTRSESFHNYNLPRIGSRSGEQRPLFCAVLMWNSLPLRAKQATSRALFDRCM